MLLILVFCLIYTVNIEIITIKVDKIGVKRNDLLVFIHFVTLVLLLIGKIVIRLDILWIDIMILHIVFVAALIDRYHGILPDKYTFTIGLLGLLRFFIIGFGGLGDLSGFLCSVGLFLLVVLSESLVERYRRFFKGDDQPVVFIGGGDLKFFCCISLTMTYFDFLIYLLLSLVHGLLFRKSARSVDDDTIKVLGPSMYFASVVFILLRVLFYIVS